MKSSTKANKTNQALHTMAPLVNGWNFIGLTNGKRTYTRNGAKATVSAGIITINGALPIHYRNVAVWGVINQILDQVQANGPTSWHQEDATKPATPPQTRQQMIDHQKRLNAEAAQAAADEPTPWYLRPDPINLKTNWNRNFNNPNRHS